MAFHEVRFPTRIAKGSTYSTTRKTDITELASGYETRNQIWAHSKKGYDVSYGVKSIDDMYDLHAFYEARLGPLNGFRFKDHFDFKSCSPQQDISNTDQSLGTGDGSTVEFQVVKVYSSGSIDYVKNIKKLVSGTLVVAINGVLSVDYSVDLSTGIITFNSPPADGASITCGFEFDTPVRFANDQLVLNLSNFRAGSVPNVPLIEVRL